MLEILFKFVISYLLGSILGSVIIGKIIGVDIRTMGSGNAGGTNAFRSRGAKFASLVLFIDIVKGYIAVSFIADLNIIMLNNIFSIDSDLLAIICGSGAVVGHVYPIYHQFKGGKGAGTMVGVLMSIDYITLLICLLIWIIILVLTGYVGLSTMVAGVIFPISIGFFKGIYNPIGIFSIIVSIFIIFTHRSNIIRMLNGEENRFHKIMFFKK